jgi:hypothetical protein
MTAISIDNLAAFGVEEINSDIADQVGGLGPWGDIVAGMIGQAIYEFLSDPGAAGRAFVAGFNATAS